jgi:hypothetical protein
MLRIDEVLALDLLTLYTELVGDVPNAHAAESHRSVDESLGQVSPRMREPEERPCRT